MSFEIGDKVFDMQYGAGIVIESAGTVSYPITVCFLDSRVETYTVEGRILNSFAMPTLYFKRPRITDIEPTRLPDLEVDTKILVRSTINSDWEKRHFKRWFNKDCVCFASRMTSWTTKRTTTWGHWKLFNEDEE